jgi:O-antigen/teichoic acid export membrane protein
MRNFFSSTLLLTMATVIHALRIMILSFLLGNTDFGAVSTILLLATLFTEFGALGFSQLIYNQPLFRPGRVSRQSRRIGLFFLTGMGLLLVSAAVVAAIASAISVFAFLTIFLTLFCAASNMMVLSACRSSRSSFTHSIAYFIKSIIVILDIVILGFFTPALAKMALWGEVVALPILIFYAWYVGILKLRWTTVREVPAIFAGHFKLGLTAIASAASGMLFFNQERLVGVAALTLEQLGILTKLLLPKMIAAQGAFLLGVHFHRMVVRMSGADRSALFARAKHYERCVVPIAMLAVAAGGYLAVQLNAWVYGIAIDYPTGLAVTVLALIFFFNPYSIMLQATSRYTSLAIANSIAVTGFVALVAMVGPRDPGVAVLSALSACLWLLVVRILVARSFSARPG